MKIIYILVSKLATWLTPFLLMIFSFGLMLGNAELHKSTLKSSDFYSQLSNEITNSEVNETSLSRGFSSIILSSIATDLITPGWIQNLVEENIDTTTDWLNGETDQWALFIPTKEIEVAVSENINQSVQKALGNAGDTIKTCSPSQAEDIRREGISLETEICLPQEVKNGEQTLTEFLNISDTDTKNSEFFEKLIRNNSLNSFSDRININDLGVVNSAQQGFISGLNEFRSLYQLIRNSVWLLLIVSLGLFLASLLSAKLADKQILYELRRLLLYTSIGTFSLVAFTIIMIGGTTYFTSYIQNLFLSGIGSSQIVNLLAFEVVKFTFNVFSLAFWIALVMIVFYGLLIFTQNSELFSKIGEKNQKLKQKEIDLDLKKNSTLDAQFQNRLLNNPDPEPFKQPMESQNFVATSSRQIAQDLIQPNLKSQPQDNLNAFDPLQNFTQEQAIDPNNPLNNSQNFQNNYNQFNQSSDFPPQNYDNQKNNKFNSNDQYDNPANQNSSFGQVNDPNQNPSKFDSLG